eukprot:gene1414-62282_t
MCRALGDDAGPSADGSGVWSTNCTVVSRRCGSERCGVSGETGRMPALPGVSCRVAVSIRCSAPDGPAAGGAAGPH